MSCVCVHQTTQHCSICAGGGFDGLAESAASLPRPSFACLCAEALGAACHTSPSSASRSAAVGTNKDALFGVCPYPRTGVVAEAAPLTFRLELGLLFVIDGERFAIDIAEFDLDLDLGDGPLDAVEPFCWLWCREEDRDWFRSCCCSAACRCCSRTLPRASCSIAASASSSDLPRSDFMSAEHGAARPSF